jgi:formate/nitrite transporter FocA (FNT family)
VVFGDGRFVALRGFGSFFVSADGETWEEQPGASSREQRGIAFSEDLHRFVVAGKSILLRTDDPVLNFSPASYDVTEGTTLQNVTVTRMGSLAGALSVDYETADGTAFAGQDYTAKSGSLTLASGKSSATIAIPISNDAYDEAPEEDFTITLSNPSAGAFLGSASVADVNIHDNDEGGTLELGQESIRVTEGKGPLTVKVPVTRTGPAPLAGGVSVTFQTYAGTAFPGEDYTEMTKTLTFPAGVSTVNAELTVLPDALDEND